MQRAREVVRRVLDRMERERLSQRALATEIGLSQGHLSKVLKLSQPANDRLLKRLEEWLAEPEARSDERLHRRLREATERAVGSSPRDARLMMQLMHIVVQLRRPIPRKATRAPRRP